MEVTKEDIPRVNYILSQDGVYENVVDDNVPRDYRWNLGTILSKTDAYMVMPNNQCVLLARELEEEPGYYEVHVAFTKKCRGKRAVEASLEAFKEFKQAHPTARAMVALIPTCNKAALVYALHAGFQRVGIRKYQSFLKDGKLYDQIRLELNCNKEDGSCHL